LGGISHSQQRVATFPLSAKSTCPAFEELVERLVRKVSWLVRRSERSDTASFSFNLVLVRLRGEAPIHRKRTCRWLPKGPDPTTPGPHATTTTHPLPERTPQRTRVRDLCKNSLARTNGEPVHLSPEDEPDAELSRSGCPPGSPPRLCAAGVWLKPPLTIRLPTSERGVSSPRRVLLRRRQRPGLRGSLSSSSSVRQPRR
jgi:hypothetical protein